MGNRAERGVLSPLRYESGKAERKAAKLRSKLLRSGSKHFARSKGLHPALSTSSRRGRPPCLPEQQRTPSDAPKGQQLTAQGIALGFCVGVVFFALKVQKLLPLQGGLPLASYNPGRCPGLAAIGLSGRCEHPAHFSLQSSICLYNYVI